MPGGCVGVSRPGCREFSKNEMERDADVAGGGWNPEWEAQRRPRQKQASTSAAWGRTCSRDRTNGPRGGKGFHFSTSAGLRSSCSAHRRPSPPAYPLAQSSSPPGPRVGGALLLLLLSSRGTGHRAAPEPERDLPNCPRTWCPGAQMGSGRGQGRRGV